VCLIANSSWLHCGLGPGELNGHLNPKLFQHYRQQQQQQPVYLPQQTGKPAAPT
jgi:hypothetical protein